MARKTVERKRLMKILKEDGWYYVRTIGDHEQYKHDTKEGKVTIKKNVPTFTTWLLKSIESQSGIKF